MFRPGSFSREENEKTWKRSVFYTDNNFMENYEKYSAAKKHVAECAKIFLEKNWKIVRDWSDLHVTIVDNTGTSTEYYKHKELSEEFLGKRIGLSVRAHEERKHRHNPINKISSMVLDHMDGDFSVEINGKSHLWIDDDSIIVIADFVEKELEKYRNFLGKRIVKHSGKPFKGGKKIATPVSMEGNPNSGNPAFKLEDGTLVDIYMCKLYEEE